MLSSKRFIVLAPTYRSDLGELIIKYGLRWESRLIHLHVDKQLCPASLVENTISSSLEGLGTLVENQQGLFLDFQLYSINLRGYPYTSITQY